MTHLAQMDKVKEVVLPDVAKMCSYKYEAVFPDILMAEDIIREVFGIKLSKLDESVYDALHVAWRRRHYEDICVDVAKMARRRNPREFDATYVLSQLREHSEWRTLRGDVRDRAEELLKELSKVN